LEINRANCKIGQNGENENDRNIDMEITVTKEDNTTGNQQTEVILTSPAVTEIPAVTNPAVTGNTGSQQTVGGSQQTVGGNQQGAGGPSQPNDIPIETISPIINTNINTANILPNTPIAGVETPQVIALKKEISEHITINGAPISREIDISNNIKENNGVYALSIK
jgi:hypothetical protein